MATLVRHAAEQVMAPVRAALQSVRDLMLRADSLRARGDAGWRKSEVEAFAHLRELIVHPAKTPGVFPQVRLHQGETVRVCSPVRLDLAGGWTDTPPYCLEHGGKVVNLAVELNGRLPIEVSVKRSERPELVLRPVGSGVQEVVRTYAQLDTFARPGNPFAVAKAALALAGFLPSFHAEGGFGSLAEQLADIGHGLELCWQARIPQGSGLGGSSILAVSILAALGDACWFEWDGDALLNRAMALEQMLTTGGGWQDQAGGLYGGLKLIHTKPGLVQIPKVVRLPADVFDQSGADRSILLYYTGVTRLAKSILAEIVRGMALGSTEPKSILADIAANAEYTAEAIRQGDYEGLVAGVRQSWSLNQRLDPQVNPQSVRRVLREVGDYLEAAKLLGAGGGGYLLMFAKDEIASARIKETLTTRPPNPRAAFVDFTVSERGLQATRIECTPAPVSYSI